MVKKTFVIGDIHGASKALDQCLERSGFDKENDELIVLGDIVDGWPETPEVIETLMGIKNMRFIMGNHDWWAYEWLEMGSIHQMWDVQGGQATIDAYVHRKPELMTKHRDEFFKNPEYYYIDKNNRMFCHGGFQRRIKLSAQLPQMFMWDRSLAEKAVSGAKSGFKVDEFKEVYLGHTTVNSFSEKLVPRNKPFWGGNVCLMDTGAGWEGVLTIMDIDSKEFWQSDLCTELYPDHRGRN